MDHDDDEPLPVDFHFYTTDTLLHNAKPHMSAYPYSGLCRLTRTLGCDTHVGGAHPQGRHPIRDEL